MIQEVHLKNFGPFKKLDWSGLGPINLVIGKNSQGKTFLLKAMYSAMRTLEEYGLGNDPRTALDILGEKLYWTFQVDKLGDLVAKGADEPLNCHLNIDGRKFEYGFGKDTTRQIKTLENHVSRPVPSVFLPAKEVLSLFHVILKSRRESIFGFDDTYVDLVKSLQEPVSKGRPLVEFSESRKILRNLLDGNVEFDPASNAWVFKRKNYKYSIGATAEGVKKIAILETLLANRYLKKGAVVFIDEPESALHPEAISKFMEIIMTLAEREIQFVIASHSYFVIKKLMIIALQRGWSLPLLSLEDDEAHVLNLKDGMPENSIVEASVHLYEEEIDLVP